MLSNLVMPHKANLQQYVFTRVYNGLVDVIYMDCCLPFLVHIIRSYPETQRELVQSCRVYSAPQNSEASFFVEHSYGDFLTTKILRRVGHTAVIVETIDTTQEIFVCGTSVLADCPAGVDDTASVGSEVYAAVAVGRHPTTRRVGRTEGHRC